MNSRVFTLEEKRERLLMERKMAVTRNLWVDMFRDTLSWLMDEDLPEAMIEIKVKKAALVADCALKEIEARWGDVA